MLTKTSAGALSARILVVGVVLLALSTGLACAAGRITAVNVTNKTDRVIITVQGDSPLKYTPIVSKQGSFIGFQFPCSLAAKGRLVGIRGGGIYNVRYSNFSSRPPLTRIVVNTYKGLNYSTDWSSDRRRVEIAVLKHGVKIASKPQILVPAATPVEQVAPGIVEEPESQPIEAVAAPKPRKLDRSAYAAIAAKSRMPRTTTPVAQIENKPEPVVEKPVVAAAPEPAPVKVKRTLDRSAYKSIAAKSRATHAPVVVASAAPAALGHEPTVRVLGVVETEKAPVEPVLVASAEQTGRVIAQPPAAPRVAVAAPAAGRVSDARRVSLNFLGADINDVLKAISMQSGQNVVASKDVTGNITLSLSNVTVDEALDYVAKLSGYTYAKADETYLVSSKDSIAKLSNGMDQGYVTEPIKLSYAKVDDVIALAKVQFPDVQVSKISAETAKSAGASKGVGPKGNLLVLTGPPDQVVDAKDLIGKFEDTFKVQSAESSRATYKVRYVSPTELAETLVQLIPGIGVTFAPSEGFNLEAPAAISVSGTGSTVESGSGGTVRATSSRGAGTGTNLLGQMGNDGEGTPASAVADIETVNRSQSIIIVGRQAEVDRAVKLAEELDVKSPQIKIEAKITSINKNAEKNLGIKWDWSELGLFEGFTDYVKQTADRDFAPEGENMQNTRKSHSKWYRQPFDIAATLDALVTDGNGEVLAAPTMVCMEGKPSVFFVGDEVTYIQRIEVTPTGQNITTDTKQVGVQLRAIGTTSPDGFITLNLHPEVSVLKLNVEQGVNLPIVTRRFTDHVVRVKDGQTLVIGGLIRSDDIIEMSKVPLLGDLPFFGQLFRHSHTSKASTEVVMFITASILKD